MIEHVIIPETRIKILRRETKWEEKLKKFVDVRIEINDDVTIESDEPIKLLRVKEVIKAFGRGFDFDTAMSLLDEEYFLEILDVKLFARKSKERQLALKGRVIGTKGRTKNIIEKYSETKLIIQGKTVSIVGRYKNVRLAKEAVEMILNGAKHASVYRFLESQRVTI
jgi:ribosomal RNA assembly protein